MAPADAQFTACQLDQHRATQLDSPRILRFPPHGNVSVVPPAASQRPHSLVEFYGKQEIRLRSCLSIVLQV